MSAESIMCFKTLVNVIKNIDSVVIFLKIKIDGKQYINNVQIIY